MNSRLSFTIPALAFAALTVAGCSNTSTGSRSTGSTSAGSTATGSMTTGSTATLARTGVATQVTVTITGGHETNQVDNGRPVVLVAALLGVTPEVFRDAFSGVTPASAGEAPESAQVSLNKQALLAVLGPYGVTNEALDTASNTYRYSAAQGETWSQSAASATATVVDGTVTAITVTDPGRGYTSTPTVLITLPDGSTVAAIATVAYTDDPATNGSITTIRV